MAKRRYSPIQFAEKYAPLKVKRMSHRAIASEMKMSTSTLWEYLHDEEYVAQIDTKPLEEIAQLETEKMLNGHITEMTDLAARLHMHMMNDAIKAKNLPLARKLSLDAMKVAKTQADIQRVLMVIGSMGHKPEIDMEAVEEQARQSIWNELCPHCRKKLMEARNK